MSGKVKRQSLNTIESSVTRLLVSTKHLLESLTQWARREVDDKYVSDAYVKLGNDFRASVRAFTHVGVDISDLGDVPQALRVILEAALSEPPSQESLDRFLPNIRNIIVTLLQNLKLKQNKAKLLSQEREKERERERKAKEVENEREREKERERTAQRIREREGTPSRPTPTSATHTPSASISARHLSSSSVKSSIPTISTNNTSSSPSTGSGATGNQSNNHLSVHSHDALMQLQKGNSLQRRASKRFSAYQYAKLTNNQPTLSSLPTITSSDRTSETTSDRTLDVPSDTRDQSFDSIGNTTNGTMVNNSVDNNSSISIFLRINNRTKKANVDTPITFNSLRLLFVEKFAYSPGTNAFPEIYIQDLHNHNISYELEEHMLSAEIKDGSLILLNEPDPQLEKLKSLEGKFEHLSTKVEEVSTHMVGEIKSLVKGIDLSPDTITNLISQIPMSKDKDVGSGPTKKVQMRTSDLAELSSIQQELRGIRQLQTKNKSILSESIEKSLAELSTLKTSALTSSKTSNRTYMDGCHAKLSEESDLLLTKVDDLQDIMEALRKDVAQRGVRVGEQQLKSTVKEIRDAKSRLHLMKEYISTEKVNWKRIWERELDTVCEEQQFFNLQDDLTNDLEDDIGRIEETYGLIEQCSLEQSKQVGYKRNKVMANLHIPEPGESLHSMKDAVLSEVAALRPNHESRLEAIEKAERLREREREMMKLTKFQAELEDFVDDAKLKKSGGFEEIERLRKLKDEENLKSSFGLI